MTILSRIKELAAIKKISLAELERQTGLSSGSITKWDKSSPSIDKLKPVANFFDVSIDYLSGNSPDTNIEKEKNSSNDLMKMIDNAMSFDGKPLSKNDREIAKAYLEGKFGTK